MSVDFSLKLFKNMDENKHFYNLGARGNPEEGEREVEYGVE